MAILDKLDDEVPPGVMTGVKGSILPWSVKTFFSGCVNAFVSMYFSLITLVTRSLSILKSCAFTIIIFSCVT